MSIAGDDDKQLDDYLRGDSDVSRRYKKSALAIGEPPAALDRAVLAQARAAVKPGAGKVTRFPARRTVRWMVPFAVAATVLLSFTVFREAGIGTLPVAQKETAPPATQSAPREADQAAVDVEVRADSEAEAKLDSRADKKAAAARQSANLKSEELIERAESRNIGAAAQKMLISRPSPPVADAIQEAVKQPPPPPVEAAPVAAPATGYLLSREKVEEIQVTGARAPKTPEVWLKDIRKLRKAGKQAEADEELKRFLQAHPDYFDKHPDIARP